MPWAPMAVLAIGSAMSVCVTGLVYLRIATKLIESNVNGKVWCGFYGATIGEDPSTRSENEAKPSVDDP